MRSKDNGEKRVVDGVKGLYVKVKGWSVGSKVTSMIFFLILFYYKDLLGHCRRIGTH